LRKIKVRNQAWKKYRKTPTSNNYREYKDIRNKVNKMIRRDQNDRTKALIKNFKNSPKRFYGYMRKMQTVKVAVSQLTVKDGSRETSN